MAARPRGGSRRRPITGSPYVRRNRRIWDATSARYDRKFAHVLGGRSAEAWGLWRIPESRLQLLGPVRGRQVLELGCGAARWSVALARRGARPVGIDLSREQLTRARTVNRTSGRTVPLVRGNAERLPFGSDRFDLVFCDWGAMTFTDPYRTVPECARVLRSGGLLVFAGASPFSLVGWDRRRDRMVRSLRRAYFGQHRFEFKATEPVEFRLTYSDWFALFRQAGLSVERLIETQPGPGAKSAYLSRNANAWARRWPLECLWRLRKE